MKTIDTPLTRLKAEYESKLAGKDLLIMDLQTRIVDAQEKVERVKGTNQMLRVILNDIAENVSAIAQQVDLMGRNISELQQRLPDLGDA